MVWKSALRYVRFWLVLALVSGHLTAEEEKLILGLHNRYRAMVSPEAADMLHMVSTEWSSSSNTSLACGVLSVPYIMLIVEHPSEIVKSLRHLGATSGSKKKK